MNILEKFWYGNLDPSEYDAIPSKEYKELVRLISRNEEKLLSADGIVPLLAANRNVKKQGKR